MQPGQRADIKVDAFPGQKFEGKVESLSGGTGSSFSLLPADNASGNFVKVVQRVPVRIAWTNAAGRAAARRLVGRRHRPRRTTETRDATAQYLGGRSAVRCATASFGAERAHRRATPCALALKGNYASLTVEKRARGSHDVALSAGARLLPAVA